MSLKDDDGDNDDENDGDNGVKQLDYRDVMVVKLSTGLANVLTSGDLSQTGDAKAFKPFCVLVMGTLIDDLHGIYTQIMLRTIDSLMMSDDAQMAY